jgi:multidrug efflux pump subunit AcrA (membrane-fusion protein)
VSADATVDEQGPSREMYYLVQIKVDPGQLARAGNGVHMTPGMQAQVSIVTGSRTIMDYLLGPMTEAMRTAMHEK